MEHKDLILEVCNLSAKIILESGGETYRAEDTVERICHSYGVAQFDVFAMPTGFFMSISDGDNLQTQAKVQRIKTRSTHLHRLKRVNDIARNITDKSISLESSLEQLKIIQREDIHKKHKVVIAMGLFSGFFTLMNGGTIIDFFVAFVCGLIYPSISSKYRNRLSKQMMTTLLSGFMVSAVCILVFCFYDKFKLATVIICTIMPLFPGAALTNAIRDTMHGDLVSGIARAGEALFKACMLSAGVGAAFSIYQMLGGTVLI